MGAIMHHRRTLPLPLRHCHCLPALSSPSHSLTTRVLVIVGFVTDLQLCSPHLFRLLITSLCGLGLASVLAVELFCGVLEGKRELMASSRGAAMAVAMLSCCCWALVIQSALAADVNSQFLDYINEYRIALTLPPFTSNTGAACVAQQVAQQYKGTPCSNTTGAGTVEGQELQLDESVLNKCNLQLVNVKDGFMAPTCVPAGTSAANAPKLAADNVTMSQAYTIAVNDSKYVSAGAGSVDNAWFVLVMATNASGGNYLNQDLDPSHAVALSVTFAPLSVLAYLVSTLILG